MTTSDHNACACPSVSTLLVVRDDETGWAHVTYDIDPRRKPRIAGLVLCDSEHALLAGMAAADFRLTCAYRVDSWSTAFLFSRVPSPVTPSQDLADCRTGDEDARATPSAWEGRLLRAVR